MSVGLIVNCIGWIGCFQNKELCFLDRILVIVIIKYSGTGIVITEYSGTVKSEKCDYDRVRFHFQHWLTSFGGFVFEASRQKNSIKAT